MTILGGAKRGGEEVLRLFMGAFRHATRKEGGRKIIVAHMQIGEGVEMDDEEENSFASFALSLRPIDSMKRGRNWGKEKINGEGNLAPAHSTTGNGILRIRGLSKEKCLTHVTQCVWI